jgi:predicted solute-binding protein
MSGAATESALIAVAGVKNSEETIEKKRRGYEGYKEIQRLICKDTGIKVEALNGYCDVIKYWRDEASHVKETAISETQAYVALNTLLRCSMFLRDNMERLIGGGRVKT